MENGGSGVYPKQVPFLSNGLDKLFITPFHQDPNPMRI